MLKDFIKYIYDYKGEEISVIGEKDLSREVADNIAETQIIEKYAYCDDKQLKFVKLYEYEQETENFIVLDGKGYNKAELIALTKDLYGYDYDELVDDKTIIYGLEEHLLQIGIRAYDKGYRPIKH